MHGRVKTRTTEEQQEIKRLEREKRLKLFRAGITKTFEKRKKGEFDEEALEITAQLLSANPDIYTLWNFRREIMQDFKEKCSVEDFQTSMTNELHLTQQCLKANPKSYGGWSHRVWVLEHMPTPDFAQELSLCNKYLEMDERNFHVWDHRRFVVAKSQVSAAAELAYSTSKIASNFSNYSSWHYRSRLLPTVFPDPLGKRPIREEEHKEELELVQSACFTDPDDTSAWFYQRWLLGQHRCPLQAILVAVTTDNAVIVSLSRPANLQRSGLAVSLAGEPVGGRWEAASREAVDHVWSFHPSEPLPPDGQPTVSVAGESVAVQLANGTGRWRRGAQFGAQLTAGLQAVLEHELDNCLQLLEMEPGSKWTMLTSVLLMQAIDRQKYKQETMEKIEELLKVDPLRTGYYKDLRSRFLMEYAIDAMEEQSSSTLDLSGIGLTAFYHGQHLALVRSANLSTNRLAGSLRQLSGLQQCVTLDLTDNALVSLADFPALPSLQTLALGGNHVCSEEIREKCPAVEVILTASQTELGAYNLPFGRRKTSDSVATSREVTAASGGKHT